MKKYRFAVITMLCILICTGCGKNLYESTKSGYINVTDVQGVTFDMPESILTQATAITSISKENDYSGSTYLYKNGKDSYLLFNIGSILVAVEAGTEYDLSDAADIEETLKNKSLNGIWLDSDAKKFKYNESNSKKGYKLVADMAAEISITPEVYGTFYGSLAYVSEDGYECTMFIGANVESRDDLSSKQEEIINHVVKSLTIKDDTIPIEETEAETTVNSETETSTQQKELETQEAEMNEPDTEELEMNEPEEGSTDVKELEIEETEEPEINTDKEETYVTRESNQDEVGNGYSDIYHLLSIGMTGRFSALGNDFHTLESSYITITNLYTGQEAVDIIKKYRNSADSLEPYTDPEAGYSWHVIEYELEKSPYDLYVDIKIEGLDGELLKYRGIQCSSRTYDIFSYMTDDYKKLYCYYAVPNGCTEYMLECGTRVTDTGDTACYRINGW